MFLCVRKLVDTVPEEVCVSCPVEQTLKCNFYKVPALVPDDGLPRIRCVELFRPNASVEFSAVTTIGPNQFSTRFLCHECITMPIYTFIRFVWLRTIVHRFRLESNGLIHVGGQSLLWESNLVFIHKTLTFASEHIFMPRKKD